METNYEPGGPHDALERDIYEGEGCRRASGWTMAPILLTRSFSAGTGQETESDRSSQDGRRRSLGTPLSSPPGSPRPSFAPRGQVKPRIGFRGKIPSGLTLNVALTEGVSKIAKNIPFDDIHGAYSNVIDSVAHAKQARSFVEELNFLVISSTLLNEQPAFGPASVAPLPTDATKREELQEIKVNPWTTNGAVAAGALGFTVACLIRWFIIGGTLIISLRRITVAAVGLGAVAWTLRTYMRRQWAKYIHEQTLNELRKFLRSSSELDSIASSALSFIFEVELIGRGYRLSLPLPPISRLENNDNGQALKSLKLRQALNQCFQDVIQIYYQTAQVIRDFAHQEQLKSNDNGFKCDTEKINDYMVRYVNMSPDDAQKTGQLRETLQLSRETRKMFLVGLMSLESTGSKTELLDYTTALQGIIDCQSKTREAYNNLKSALLPDRATGSDRNSASPLSPRHMKWKHQIDKVGGMNMNIRTIQAKMYSLLEESKKTLDTADDVSELGHMFMSRYDNIGKDIEDLMESWEAGKASLAKNINKNERRVSSMSSIMSPTIDPSMEAVREESGDADDGVSAAWDKLTGGELPPAGMADDSSPTSPRPMVMETFEAIAAPRPRSTLTRTERIARAHEDRQAREAERAQAMQRGHVMGELRDVLKSRGLHATVDTNTKGGASVAAQSPSPSNRQSFGPILKKRVVSMPFP
ncbi:Mysoin-binding motif of peroxisomes-domain-containing protein [Truncatella angustata]|uniref:Mysoin-binding motif of peroxisomes-domain-containing protein n=1 Tax=Truncatella angustata TaxID=152316 RepID=A0A9P8UXU0_9PEZI|nr:Mysoin-binding motif of peroxisomes-domain-containing protein [Truncatella angustata]KAH6660135.1 Mysoin-binding motif of peroxisomes-domain-containing protein [Truncatella angustata]